MYELIKDVFVPGAYYRAGTQHTQAEWIAIFPTAFKNGDGSNFFIDLSSPIKKEEQDIITDIISEVFGRAGLHSISYREAARECMLKYKEINK